MRYWVFNITRPNSLVTIGSGWIRAESFDEACALVGRSDADLVEIPDDRGFPPDAVRAITWTQRPLALH